MNLFCPKTRRFRFWKLEVPILLGGSSFGNRKFRFCSVSPTSAPILATVPPATPRVGRRGEPRPLHVPYPFACSGGFSSSSLFSFLALTPSPTRAELVAGAPPAILRCTATVSRAPSCPRVDSSCPQHPLPRPELDFALPWPESRPPLPNSFNPSPRLRPSHRRPTSAPPRLDSR